MYYAYILVQLGLPINNFNELPQHSKVFEKSPSSVINYCLIK